nr:tripartite motif-containing protein 44-like [Aedes albopictus]
MKAVAILMILAMVSVLDFAAAAPKFQRGRVERWAQDPEPTEGAPEAESEKPEEEAEEKEEETSEDESGGDEAEGEDHHGKHCPHDEESGQSESEPNAEGPAKSEK